MAQPVPRDLPVAPLITRDFEVALFCSLGAIWLQRPWITKIGQEPNGMKLAAALVLYQLLTQFLPGCDHQGEALRPPFLDARLYAMRSDGVDDQRS